MVQHMVSERGVAASVFTLVDAVAGGCEAAVELVLGLMARTRRAHFALPYAAAAVRGDRATLEYLRRRRVPWGARVMAEAVGTGVQLPVLRWMAEQGAPWDCKAVGHALGTRVAWPWPAAVVRAMPPGGYERSRAWLARTNELRSAREEAVKVGILAARVVWELALCFTS